jgi:hypothetical protein
MQHVSVKNFICLLMFSDRRRSLKNRSAELINTELIIFRGDPGFKK